MKKPVSFFDIVAAMKARTPIKLKVGQNSFRNVWVNGIEAEDGSGLSWNVKLQWEAEPLTEYWNELKADTQNLFI